MPVTGLVASVFSKRLAEGHDNICGWVLWRLGLPWWLRSKESTCNAEDAGDTGSILKSGRSPGGGNGNPLQYSCLKNLIDRGV